MKAAITKNYGPANVIELREVPTPTISEDQVLVQVHASPVTAGDRRLRAADFPGMSAVPGRLMMGVFGPRNGLQGTMFAGRVVQIGTNVTEYAVGDDVFGSVDHGAYAEYLAVPQDGKMAKMPDGISYKQAASAPYGAVTALIFLRDLAQLERGQKVLVLGASGGVGRYAVQLAKYMGAEVTGVSSARNARLVRSLGADHVIDYATQDFSKLGHRYDVIFDIADASSFEASRDSLTPNGRYLSLYISMGLLWQMVRTSNTDGKQAKFTVAMGSKQDMEAVRELLAEGVLKPVIAREFSIDRIVEAHAAADGGRIPGTVVVSMAPAQLAA